MINPTRVFALPLTTLPLITLTALSLTLLPSFSASAAVIEPVNNEKLAIVEVRHSNLAGYFMGQAPEILLSGDTGTTVLQPGQKYRFLPSRLPLNVAAGKRGEIEVKRLDVNQVKVVREDQSEYLAPSKFRVQYKRADGMMADYELAYYGCPTKVGQFDAPAGLYLPPGEYKVILDYKTAEGPKVKVIDATL